MLGTTLSPSLASFTPSYDKGLAQLVHTVLVGDLETPVSAFMKLRAAFSGHAFLLESVEGGAIRGRRHRRGHTAGSIHAHARARLDYR